MEFVILFITLLILLNVFKPRNKAQEAYDRAIAAIDEFYGK